MTPPRKFTTPPALRPKHPHRTQPEQLRGRGRPPGVQNKSTIVVKTAILEAFDLMGGLPQFVEWARENQTEFYRMWSRIMPLQLSGDGGAAIQVQVVRFSDDKVLEAE